MPRKKYADYMDSHDNIILQSVRAEQERLQNDMSLAYQVYSQVANQLRWPGAKVQEVSLLLYLRRYESLGVQRNPCLKNI